MTRIGQDFEASQLAAWPIPYIVSSRGPSSASHICENVSLSLRVNTYALQSRVADVLYTHRVLSSLRVFNPAPNTGRNCAVNLALVKGALEEKNLQPAALSHGQFDVGNPAGPPVTSPGLGLPIQRGAPTLTFEVLTGRDHIMLAKLLGILRQEHDCGTCFAVAAAVYQSLPGASFLARPRAYTWQILPGKNSTFECKQLCPCPLLLMKFLSCFFGCTPCIFLGRLSHHSPNMVGTVV